MHRPLAAALLAASTLSTVPTLAQSSADSLARQVDAMFAQYDRQPSPGLAIAVVRDGRVLLRRGYGLADVEGRVPITPETSFDLASLAKQFTGAAVATLALEGKIRPGDDIRRYLPELADFGHPITIDHLLHHTSGIRDWTVTLPVAGATYDDPISLDQILAMAYRQRSLNFVPGAEHTYSNTGYNLLAEMVQRVTRQPLRRFTEARFFGPLGMTRTHVHEDDAEVIADRAYGYARLPDGRWRRTPDHLTAVGSSSVYGTVDDLARWMINFDQRRVGGRALLDLMLTRGRLNDGSDVPYGFGLVNGVYRGQPMFTHSGGWASFDTYMAYLPRQRFGVVVLANSEAVGAQNAVTRITDLYLRNELDPVAPEPAAPCAPARTSPAALDAYAGLYRLGPGWLLRVRHEGGGLVAQASHEDAFPMTPRCGSTFHVQAYGADVEFRPDAAGRVASLEYRGMVAPRLPESAPPAPARLADYAGEYVSGELGTVYRVAVVNGGLEMRHVRHGTIPLTWLWRDEFGSTTWFLKSITFERSASGRVTGFLVNGSERARDMRFAKRR